MKEIKGISIEENASLKNLNTYKLESMAKYLIKVETIDAVIPEKLEAINIVEIVIKKGNLPLQGTKTFVKIAINLSLGESIILHPHTPAALQPNPMHMVIICLPLVYAFLKHLSILKAIRGK